MPIRRFLSDLAILPLANPAATGDTVVVVAPDGTLKRQSAQAPMNKLVFGPGTTTFQIPAGVTALQVEAQAAGGGGGGGGTSSPAAPGGTGGDGGTTEVHRGATVLLLANGGRGGRGGANGASLPNAGLGGFGGTGGISYRGLDTVTANGANGGVTTVDPQRGLAGSSAASASSGGGGAGGLPSGSGGGGGEYLTGGIPVTPGETLTLVVGAPGVGGAPATSLVPGHPGGGGFLVVTW